MHSDIGWIESTITISNHHGVLVCGVFVAIWYILCTSLIKSNGTNFVSLTLENMD
jgi:hypothetical protein